MLHFLERNSGCRYSVQSQFLCSVILYICSLVIVPTSCRLSWAYTCGNRQWRHTAPSSLPFQSPFGGLGLYPAQVRGPLCLRHTNLELEHSFQKCSCALRSGLSKAHCSQPYHWCHSTLSDKPYMQRPRGGTLLCLVSFTQSYIEVGSKARKVLRTQEGRRKSDPWIWL